MNLVLRKLALSRPMKALAPRLKSLGSKEMTYSMLDGRHPCFRAARRNFPFSVGAGGRPRYRANMPVFRFRRMKHSTHLSLGPVALKSSGNVRLPASSKGCVRANSLVNSLHVLHTPAHATTLRLEGHSPSLVCTRKITSRRSSWGRLDHEVSSVLSSLEAKPPWLIPLDH